ncbi:MAG: hypothetical protein IPP74_14885 [Alphaproteobacteria bacterium]|nr:hypothetical protein [Alphaproteobacteria bacterium]
MLIVQRQVYLLGTVSTEIWENDGSTPFSRIPGGLIQIGCLAKYSPIIRGNSIIWLGHTRQFVEFTGTNVKFLGSQYDKELAKFGTVTDCIGSYVQHDGQEHCIFYFPTEDRTLVYDPVSENWCEWAHWDSEALEWKAYDIRSSAKDLTSGKTLVGKKAKYIAALESKSRVDMVGTRYKAFKFLRQTGWIDHGNSKRKRCEQLSFRVTRGDPAPEDNSVAAAAGSPNTGDFINE